MDKRSLRLLPASGPPYRSEVATRLHDACAEAVERTAVQTVAAFIGVGKDKVTRAYSLMDTAIALKPVERRATVAAARAELEAAVETLQAVLAEMDR